ncbi:hypothetical protein GGR51DRAFT_502105 [Nemania sp. FL0031]|nr:hypothetical protein GGR51DRAFT_502105 [Nemania sp. FL0031]
MEDRKSELLQYAREYATANKDLYELLAVSPEAAQPEVHRAWRKASLKHHPDKAVNFDPEVWQLFERARDVLSAPEARAAYDAARAAAVREQKARAALDEKRRAMIEDLEARERGVKRKAGDGDGGEGGGRHMMTEAEKRVLMQKGREHLEKRQRMRDEAEARERERERDRTRMEEEEEDGDGGQGRDAARTEDAESRAIPPNSARTPGISTPTSTEHKAEDANATRPPPDEYDERIADLERKLRERKASKAARKADKKKNKNKSNHKEESDEATSIGGGNPTTETPPPPPSIPSTWPKPASASVPGDFSSTMAKLRAAQREKERKKAEAEAEATAGAAAAATPAMTSDG